MFNLYTIPTVAAIFLAGVVISNNVFADETEKRRVDISVSIFPRIVAVDNDFRKKLDKDGKAQLLFVYDGDERYARELAGRVGKKGSNIGGISIVTRVISVSKLLRLSEIPMAIFMVERLDDKQLEKVIVYAESVQRLLFSPFSGDVERGVTVGISVTNRVKPFFNLSALRRSEVEINKLLMKMSKHHE